MVAEDGYVAVADLDLPRRAGDDVPVPVCETDPDHLIEGLHPHGSGIHPERSPQVSRDAVHPFETGEAGGSGHCRELFEPHPDTGRDFVPLDSAGREATSCQMGHHTGEAAVPDQEVGSAPHHHEGNPLVVAETDQLRESLLGFRLGPEAGGPPDPHGGVARKGLGESDDPLPHRLEETLAKPEFPGKPGAGLVDVPRAEGDDKVSLSRDRGRCLCGGGDGNRRSHALMPGICGRGDDRAGVDARDRGLPRRIDRGDKDEVCITESRSEFTLKRRRAGETVRLEKDDEAPFSPERVAGGLQRGGDLRRMMAVVIEDLESLVAVLEFEATLRPAEALQGGGDRCEGDPEVGGECDHQKRVVRVVRAGDAKQDAAEEFPATEDGEARGKHILLEPFQTVAAMGARSDRDRAFHSGAKARGPGVVRPVVGVPRGLAEEPRKDRVDGRQIGVVVQVLRFDVQDDGVPGVVVDERAVALVPLGDEEFPLGIPTRVGSENRDLGPDIVGGLEPPRPEDMRGHGGGRGLAVHPADHHPLLPGHDGGEDFGTANDPLAERCRGIVGGISLMDRGGADDKIGIPDDVGAVGCREAESLATEAPDLEGVDLVGTADGVAERQQQGGDPAHAGTGNADEMDAQGRGTEEE